MGSNWGIGRCGENVTRPRTREARSNNWSSSSLAGEYCTRRQVLRTLCLVGYLSKVWHQQTVGAPCSGHVEIIVTGAGSTQASRALRATDTRCRPIWARVDRAQVLRGCWQANRSAGVSSSVSSSVSINKARAGNGDSRLNTKR